MIAQSTIRTAHTSEISACLEILTRAFETDPVCLWAWPDKAAYRDAFPRFCRAFGGAAFEAGTAHVEDACKGVALWLAPGVAPDEETLINLTRKTVPEHRLEPMFALFEQMGSWHPQEAHWHLPLIGVDPSLQGRGVGSALLRHALRKCDQEGTLAYLEATNADNRRLYERHGFEALGVIQAGDSPPITPMSRKPRPWAF